MIPWIISRFGFRRAMVIAFAAMSLRYGCFLLSSSLGLHIFDFGGILIHGLIFGILIIGSQMHIDEIAPRELRNQAQGLVMLLSAGIGIFTSNFVFDAVIGSFGWTVAFAVALALAAAGKVLTLLLMR
jgi:sugar phosphate permease